MAMPASNGAERKIRILIVDDHAVVRQGLRMYLGLDPTMEVVGEGSNGEEGVRLAIELHPDVVLMDLVMPVMDGCEAIREIRRQLPGTEVFALTSGVGAAANCDALDAGASSYLLKNADPDEVRRAIRASMTSRPREATTG